MNEEGDELEVEALQDAEDLLEALPPADTGSEPLGTATEAKISDCDGGSERVMELDGQMAATFSANPLPAIILDEDLEFLLVNDACRRLFGDFYCFDSSLFSDIFGKALGVQALRELREATHSPASGYSWKHTIKSKDRSAGTILTKAFFFPLYMDRGHGAVPSAFVLLFDDVTEEHRELLRNVFLSLLEASKLKDNDTGRHILRVNLYSQHLAEYLFDRPGYEAVDRDFIDDIGFLAAMHDVGKIGTPDDILNKEGPLADWEWSIMKEHTKNGAYILSTYPNPMAREIALYHHERWDGSGYPYKLEGTMIPLSARIVTIADVYDALRMKRSYKPAYDHRTAMAKIAEWSESHFDPALTAFAGELADGFERIYEENAD